MKAAIEMLFALGVVCLFAAAPTMAARDLLEETAGSFQQCGGTGDGCTGSKCKDAQWATCSTKGFKCYRISQYYWQCADKQPPVQPAGAYSQCGGEGGSCKGAQCKDAEWPGASCPTGYGCQRINHWWWQCNKAASSEGAPTPTPVPAKTPTPVKPTAPTPVPAKPTTPTPTKPTGPAKIRHVHTYAQCGGEGGTCKSEGQCKDAAWTDVACLSYDSCTRINHWWWQCNPKPVMPSPSPTPVPAAVKPFNVGKYDQCGGAGGSCKGAQCKDAVWPGATCPSGFSCYRVSQWWRQCDTHPLD